MQPLKGLKVVDLTTFLATPTTGRILGEWGADVIKVEPSFGDPGRGTGATMSCPIVKDCNPFYTAYNANKRGLSLNLKSEEGKAILDKALTASRAREAARKARESIRRKTALGGAASAHTGEGESKGGISSPL